jgi:hypothetical protein
LARTERQDNFGGGELSTTLRGRIDIALYSRAIELGRNFIVGPDGHLDNRPGMVTALETKLSGASKAGLFPFIFGGGQNYMLEFGVGYIRFFQLGAVVLNGGVPYEVATPWAEVDLPFLKLTQSGDTVEITRAGYATKELKRIAHTNWTLTDFARAPLVQPATGLVTSGAVPAADAQHAGKAWDIIVTSITGGDYPEESTPSNVLGLANTTALYPDRPVTYTWTAPATGPAPSKYGIYRAVGGTGRYGFIGESATTTFRDDGQVPLYSEPPPFAYDPFAGAGNNAPQVSTFHGQRLFFFNSINAPNSGWSSRLAAFRSFDRASPPKDDDAITFTIASRRYDEIRSAVPLSDLLLFGSGAEWLLRGVNGPLTPTTVNPEPLSYWGSSWLEPVVMGETPLFVTDIENHVRELIVGGDSLGQPINIGQDLSIVASHLFKNHTIVSTFAARRPHSLAGYVRDDGKVLLLSYIKQLQQVAWTWLDTDGVVEWACSIPEGAEDAVYFIVKRTVNGVSKRYVERWASRQAVVNTRTCNFLDGSKLFDGKNTTATTVTVTGVYTVGGVVALVASAGLFGVGSGPVVNDEVVLMPGEDGGDVRILITAFADGTHATGSVVSVGVPLALQGVATADWGVGKKTYAGLTQLVGATIRVVADGITIDGLAVDGAGNLTLVTPAVRVCVGRGYTPDLGLLPLRELRNREKNVKRCVFEVVDTAPDGLQAGETLSDLSDVKVPPEDTPGASGLVGSSSSPYTVPVGINATWNLYGRAYLRQSKPLPLSVLAVTREVVDGQ